MITLLKIELLPTLRERMENMKKETLKQERKETLEELEKLKGQLKSMEPKKDDEQ